VGSGIATNNGTQTMTTIKLFGGDLGNEEMMIRCDLSEASSPVQVDYRNEIQDVGSRRSTRPLTYDIAPRA